MEITLEGGSYISIDTPCIVFSREEVRIFEGFGGIVERFGDFEIVAILGEGQKVVGSLASGRFPESLCQGRARQSSGARISKQEY